MFPRRKRLTRTAFPALLRGRRLSSTHFSATISKEVSGYAVVVSKKTARLSVTRHRLKRRILAALRALPHLPSSVVIFPKISATTLPYEETKAELGELLSKIQ